MNYHKPGIYFGMPEAEYHADPSFSSSGIKAVLWDPEEYYDTSPFNPSPAPREQKDCLSRGTLWHCRILERELFDHKYILAPYLTDDFANGKRILRTIDDMKEWLDDNGIIYKKSMNKDGYENSIREACLLGLANDEPYLFDQENAGFANLHADKTVIWSRDIYESMLAAEKVIEDHPYFSQVFKGGYSEVSIFWEDETGVRMKRRIDKLKPNAILDYKTLHVRRGKSARQSALDAIKFEKYDVDVAVSVIAVATAVNMIKDGSGVIEGDVSGEFLDDLCKTAEKPFGFVFQKEDRPYTVRGLKIVRRGGDLFNVFGAGLVYMQQGIQTFLEYSERFGTDRWYNPDGMTEIAENEIYYS